MCGRYYLNQEICPSQEALVLTGRGNFPNQVTMTLNGKRNYPNQAPMAKNTKRDSLNPGRSEKTAGKRSLSQERMRWGFPVPGKKERIINARAETALEKRIFRDSLLYRRCAVPASHYYEWNKEKERVTFRVPGETEFYMAGFYQRYGEEDCFVILTVAANASVEPVHDRMPLILTKEQVEPWICEEGMTEFFLSQGSPMLEKYQEYEQLTLF